MPLLHIHISNTSFSFLAFDKAKNAPRDLGAFFKLLKREKEPPSRFFF